MPEFNLLHTLLFIAVLIPAVLGLVAYLTLAERKVSAWVQDRIGPNRVGPLGLLQPLVDGGKFFLKEDVIPRHVDRAFFVMAPAVAFITALLGIAVVPVGSTVPPPAATSSSPVPYGSRTYTPVAYYEHALTGPTNGGTWAVAPGLDIGILYVFALGSLAVYGVILAGWSSDNKYSLLGALRSSAQIVSYEIPLGMSVLGVVLLTGANGLNPEAIVAGQLSHGWYLFTQPLACLLFFTAACAECSRLPFDLPEAEQELVGGYHTEYSSLKLGMLLLAEYAHLITASLLFAVLFLGGWHFWGLTEGTDSQLYSPTTMAVLRGAVLVGKGLLFIGFVMLIRWTIPRFRFDQLMSLAWKVMIPLALLNLVCVLVVKQFGLPLWSLSLTSLGLFVGAGLAAVLTGGSVSAPRRKVRRLPPGLPEGVTFAAR